MGSVIYIFPNGLGNIPGDLASSRDDCSIELQQRRIKFDPLGGEALIND